MSSSDVAYLCKQHPNNRPDVAGGGEIYEQVRCPPWI